MTVFKPNDQTEWRLLSSLTIRRLLNAVCLVAMCMTSCSLLSRTAIAFSFPASAKSRSDNNEDNRPNVIIILSDDQGWADIGYNNSKVYTPVLDQLATTGVTFGNHFVMPQCTPTRVALMTGRYPSRFGGPAMAASNQPAFPLGTPTIASMFRAKGYETFLSGKWHLGSSFKHGPSQFGFDHSYGSLTGAVGMYDHHYRKGKFQETWHRDQEIIEGFENGTHATDLVAREAVRIIKAERDKPFFLYVPFHSVHTPLDERGDFVDQPTKLDVDNPKRWTNEDKIKWFNDPQGIIQKELDPEKRLLLAAAYHLDSAVGEIVKALEDSGQRENTLILFSSDNGPQGSWGGNAYPDDLKLTNFNQPLPMRGKKVDVWEGGIHVPGFANWPGKISPKHSKELVHIIDWYPSLAKLIDYQPETPIAWDGADLSSILFGNKQNSDLFEDRELYFTWSNKINRWAYRMGDWKVVKYGVGQPVKPDDWQLFDLSSDPKEKNNVAQQNPQMLSRLHQRFLVNREKDKRK